MGAFAQLLDWPRDIEAPPEPEAREEMPEGEVLDWQPVATPADLTALDAELTKLRSQGAGGNAGEDGEPSSRAPEPLATLDQSVPRH